MKKQHLMEQELIERTERGRTTLEQRLEALERNLPLADTLASTAAITNMVDNTDWNWSTLAYTTAGTTPGTAGDDNNRAYNWYRMQRATALLVENDASSLKGPAHSLFAAES